MNWNSFCDKLIRILNVYKRRMNFSYNDKEFVYYLNDVKHIYTKKEYLDLKNRSSKYDYEDFLIKNDSYYEIGVNINDKLFNNREYYKEVICSNYDNSNEVSFDIKECSDELIYYFILNFDFDNMRVISFDVSKFFIVSKNECNKGLFSLLRHLIRFPICIRVMSLNNIGVDKLEDYLYSYIYNLSVNEHIIIRIVSNIVSIVPKRKYKFDTIILDSKDNLPSVIYNRDLLCQFNMANSSDNSFVKYIAFYHIIEYFFESVYVDDMIENIQDKIKSNSFSVDNKKDINDIIKYVNNKRICNSDRYTFNEKEALELVLRKYVSINDLKLSLFSEWVNFNNDVVSFSNGDIIDFSLDNFYKSLSNRIYKTRNSLVHNKSNELSYKNRGVYDYIKNLKELDNEVILLEKISLLIIRNSAKKV